MPMVKPGQELSLLACVTGLALLAGWLGLLLMHGPIPQQLPLLIAAVGGFELSMAGYALVRWMREARR